MSTADHVTQLQQELSDQYDQLTRVINGLQRAIGRATDGEARLSLQDRLKEREQERESVVERQEFVEQHADDIRAGKVELPGLPELGPAPGPEPYKGLQYFDLADADNFFGRETLTAELVDFLRHNSLLAVVGASGSGKSSLVRAGLVAALKRGQPLADASLPPEGSAGWPVHVIPPTARPLESLAASLTRDSESDLEAVKLADELARDPRILHFRVRRLLSKPGTGDRLLLVVDQFEELFTLCKDKAQRKAFVDNLLTAACPEADGCSPADTSTLVVLALRADFYAQCAEFDNLRAALERYQRYIGAMSREELRRAIEAPAERGSWHLEPGLVNMLLQEVGDEPGALPLLSHALLETWNRRRGHTLTLAGYAASGRVQGAIAKTADDVYTKRLTREQQEIARRIFLELTELGEGAQDTRRRVTLQNLIPQNETASSVEKVLKVLADARLVTTFQDGAEVAHEALIRQWPALREWLEADRESLRFGRRLDEAAREWQREDEDSEALHRGARLAQALEWATSHQVALKLLTQRFLDASHVAVEQAENEKKAARERERLAVVGEVTAGLIHMMSNRIGPIPALVDRVAKDVSPDHEETHRKLRHIYEGAADALSYTARLAKLMMLGGIDREEVEVRVLLDSALTQVLPEPEGHGIVLQTNYGEESYKLCVNAPMIIEALCNIIWNAVEAMHQGGRLLITVEKSSEDGIHIRISDTGGGIPEDRRPEVFRLGFTTKKGGIGLGLWFSKQVVEQHGGSISFESQEGMGTTISVFLPRS